MTPWLSISPSFSLSHFFFPLSRSLSLPLLLFLHIYCTVYVFSFWLYICHLHSDWPGLFFGTRLLQVAHCSRFRRVRIDSQFQLSSLFFFHLHHRDWNFLPRFSQAERKYIRCRFWCFQEFEDLASIHTCIHAYMHTCIHTCIHACIHAYMHACIPTYIHIHTHTYTYIHIHTHTYTYIHIHTHTYTYSMSYIQYTHLYASTCRHVRIAIRLVLFTGGWSILVATGFSSATNSARSWERAPLDRSV